MEKLGYKDFKYGIFDIESWNIMVNARDIQNRRNQKLAKLMEQ
jgi:hypothetical protein